MSSSDSAASTLATHGKEGHYDPVGSRIGMWLFLFTEALLFGTLFIAYAVYLKAYRLDFADGSHHLDKLLGALNTVILLTSSLTMAMAVAALQRGKRGASLRLQIVTLLCAIGFLCIKSYEWSHKFHDGIWPKSPKVLAEPEGLQIFYGLYFAMTGLHALHVIIGMTVIISAMILIRINRVTPDRTVFLENTGLYWHLVDLIWIYLFPLFYLIH